MKGFVGGPLSVGGLGPWPPAALKSGPANPKTQIVYTSAEVASFSGCRNK